MTDRLYVSGILAAMTEVARVTGPIKVADLTEQSWKLICEINIALARLAADEAAKLDAAENGTPPSLHQRHDEPS